jgi:hypothetical protein
MINLNFIDFGIIFLSLIGFTLINPIGDAIRDSGNKKLQKRLEVGRDFLIFVILYILTKNHQFVVCFGLSYFFYRVSLHNLSYNRSHTPKLPWWHTGTTSDPDIYEQQLRENTNITVILISRIATFLFASFLFYLATKYA